MQHNTELGLYFQHGSYALGVACRQERVKSREESEGEEVRGCTLKSPGLRQIGRGGVKSTRKDMTLAGKRSLSLTVIKTKQTFRGKIWIRWTLW